jgi:hypothetical protein
MRQPLHLAHDLHDLCCAPACWFHAVRFRAHGNPNCVQPPTSKGPLVQTKQEPSACSARAQAGECDTCCHKADDDLVGQLVSLALDIKAILTPPCIFY